MVATPTVSLLSGIANILAASTLVSNTLSISEGEITVACANGLTRTGAIIPTPGSIIIQPITATVPISSCQATVSITFSDSHSTAVTIGANFGKIQFYAGPNGR